jgi:hypothetical protein
MTAGKTRTVDSIQWPPAERCAMQLVFLPAMGRA